MRGPADCLWGTTLTQHDITAQVHSNIAAHLEVANTYWQLEAVLCSWCIERDSIPILVTIPFPRWWKGVAVYLFCLFWGASLLSKFWEEEACKTNLDNKCAVAPVAGHIGALLLLNAMIDELKNRAVHKSGIIKSFWVLIPAWKWVVEWQREDSAGGGLERVPCPRQWGGTALGKEPRATLKNLSGKRRYGKHSVALNMDQATYKMVMMNIQPSN